MTLRISRGTCLASFIFLFFFTSAHRAHGTTTITGIKIVNGAYDTPKQGVICPSDLLTFYPTYANPGDSVAHVWWRVWCDPDNTDFYSEQDNGNTEEFSDGPPIAVGKWAVQVVIAFAAGENTPSHTETSPKKTFDCVPPDRAEKITMLPVKGPHQMIGSDPNIEIRFAIEVDGRSTLMTGQIQEKIMRSPYNEGDTSGDRDWFAAPYISEADDGIFTDMKGVNATDLAWAGFAQMQQIDKLTCQYAIMIMDVKGNVNRYVLDGTFGFIFYKDGNDVGIAGF